ncbi:Fur family transcriptional regulator [Enterovirga rhinocerotis]|uniref:Ferric uptake regulation protein n=1 Tax=Enterovirga rhinocerotis TaxID=1339210 RepID=A0A4R7BUS8_9HYPH|nr:Fur family transcriptional regulator [Enterovirga rhinocerotis]TDR89568.1 Fur family ferric uptake regulator [Enterovirga rhinocerotis]
MDRANELEGACREQGLRMTGQRLTILSVLSRADDHPDAAELHRRAAAIDPGISMATVYRTVKLLQDKGILARHAFADGPARYESAAQAHHDHLIDIESGRVIEFHSPEIERLQEEIARNLGFRIVSHRLEIYAKPIKGRKRP